MTREERCAAVKASLRETEAVRGATKAPNGAVNDIASAGRTAAKRKDFIVY